MLLLQLALPILLLPVGTFAGCVLVSLPLLLLPLALPVQLLLLLALSLLIPFLLALAVEVALHVLTGRGTPARVEIPDPQAVAVELMTPIS